MKAPVPQLKDKVVLLTGGAGPLDATLATGLAIQGAKVHLAIPEKIDCKITEDQGITIHQFDLSSRSRFEEAVSRIVARHQHIDILINASGAAVFGLVRHLSLEDWEEVFNNNILGVINAIELTYPAMVERGSGHIVNLCSITSDTPQPGSIPFAASKAFVLGLDRSLRPEAKRTGIDLTLILPGYLPPAMFQQSRAVKVDAREALDAHTLVESTAERFVDAIISGVIRKKRSIYFPGFQARLLWFLSHWFPAVLRPLQKRLLKPFNQPPSLASRTHRPPQ